MQWGEQQRKTSYMYITKHYDATFDMKRERMFVGCACVPQTFDDAFRTKLGSSRTRQK